MVASDKSPYIDIKLIYINILKWDNIRKWLKKEKIIHGDYLLVLIINT